VGHIAQIVTVTAMVCLIAWIATAMAMVFRIGGTGGRTIPADTKSKQ
jgi:hypothetical protein